MPDFSRKLIVLLLLLTSSSASSFPHGVCVDNIRNNSRAITGLILARGGSKGIILKNIQRIDGVSLLGISITAMQETKRFNTIWVSTDHEAIAEEAQKYHVSVHWRDPKTALDTTSSIDSVKEFLHHHPKVNKLALVQCTSPFINKIYVLSAIKAFKKRSCVFSAYKSYKLRWIRELKISRVLPLNFHYSKRPRRQDWDGELVETGMFYFSSRNLLDIGLFQDDRCGVIEVDQKDSLEIDTPNDLAIARLLFKIRN